MAKGAKIGFTSERNGTSDRIDLYATFSKCDFIESLMDGSVMVSQKIVLKPIFRTLEA